MILDYLPHTHTTKTNMWLREPEVPLTMQSSQSALYIEKKIFNVKSIDIIKWIIDYIGNTQELSSDEAFVNIYFRNYSASSRSITRAVSTKCQKSFWFMRREGACSPEEKVTSLLHPSLCQPHCTATALRLPKHPGSVDVRMRGRSQSSKEI